MATNTDSAALYDAVSQIYLEVFPASGVAQKLQGLPDGSHVGITCSPSKGIGATLDLVEQLSEHAFNLVPHIAARQVRDAAHLRDILAHLEAHAIKSVFVPGGDIPKPAGQFDSALSVLRVMAEIGHDIRDIGVAAHPEDHPFIGSEVLRAALREKQAFASYFVTQMCFDANLLIDWLKSIRKQGISMNAWVGLPGVIDRGKLMATSLRIGVGESAKFALKQRTLVAKLLTSKRYVPDGLLQALSGHLDDRRLGIAGFYLFSFNHIDATLKWQAEMLKRLV